ncbi:unnamed protein product [Lactuca saligna]|uniref:Transmembrane protein n=1 Tax=Lactuca saligna TaxID=75948 RepID=A0AA35V546_LACSI|nr:unnamed protein product [Lactuca saligna]
MVKERATDKQVAFLPISISRTASKLSSTRSPGHLISRLMKLEKPSSIDLSGSHLIFPLCLVLFSFSIALVYLTWCRRDSTGEKGAGGGCLMAVNVVVSSVNDGVISKYAKWVMLKIEHFFGWC